MATTGIGNGTLTALYSGGTKIAHLTGNQISLSHSTRDGSSKDSLGRKDVLEGQTEWGFSGEGYFAEDAAYGFTDLAAAWKTRSTFTIRQTSSVTGDTYYEGTCYITSLEQGHPLEDSSTFSVTFEGTGELTIGTES